MPGFDVIIFGGGASGLWLLALLQKRGYDVLLLEASKLGSGQTIASQGIVHKGYKYIGGEEYDRKLVMETNESAGLWRNSFSSSDADVRLPSHLILSEKIYYVLHHSEGTELLNHVRMELKIEMPNPSLEQSKWPANLSSDSQSSVLVASETVLDIPRLLRVLYAPVNNCVRRLTNPSVRWQQNQLILDDSITLSTKCVVFCAGLGNEGIARQLGVRINVQRRRLRMVLVGSVSSDVYAHFCEHGFSPELTITTHPSPSGKFWYLGGELAERGANQRNSELIENAQVAIGKYLPSANLEKSRWSTFFVERAEVQQEGGFRPSTYSIHQHDRLLFAWPTKICLVPKMCYELLSLVSGIVGAPTRAGTRPPGGLDSNAQFATPPWYDGGNDEHSPHNAG